MMIESDEHPAGSYYAATANPIRRFEPLAGDTLADVAILGGGYTGLAAALHLAEAGKRVVLLEAHRVGWGASGRNGGQVHTGQRRDQDYLEAAVGREAARRLWTLAEEAKAHLKQLVSRYGIRCDYRAGLVHAAHKPAYVGEMQRYADKLARDYGYDQVVALDKAETARALGTDVYHGGWLDKDGGHLHPLNFALGLAEAADRAGAVLHEGTRVTGYARTRGGKVRVATTRGAVEAEYLLLCGDGYLEGISPKVEAAILPINNFVLATEPLPPALNSIVLPEEPAASDSRFVVNYWRKSADGRLIFGGGENYSHRFPSDLRAFVRRHMLKVYPKLGDVRIDHAWGGAVSITVTRLPYLRKVEPNVLVASGYSGQGVMLAPFAGKLLAEAVSGTLDRFDVFRDLPVPSFPGGRLLRWPALVAGMTWFALRDRL
jgi:gamma-glutamylputrescine oxidase